MRVVIVGAGEVAESFWLPATALLGARVELIDVDESRAAALADSAGPAVAAAPSIASANPTEEDLVVVATPPATHGAVVREAIHAGARRVLVEKPPFSTSEDLEETAQVVGEEGVALHPAFVRRQWQPIVVARRVYPTWRHRFGPLRQVRITEGRPFGWVSRAAAERGIAGLAGMLLDEMPHALDALFRVVGWVDAPSASVIRADLNPLDVHAEVELAVGEGVRLELLGSRTGQLPTAIDLGFQAGTVTIEMQPNGGIVVRPGAGERTLVYCGGIPDDVESMFAGMLRDLAAATPGQDEPNAVDLWRGPLALIERLQEGP